MSQLEQERAWWESGFEDGLATNDQRVRRLVERVEELTAEVCVWQTRHESMASYAGVLQAAAIILAVVALMGWSR